MNNINDYNMAQEPNHLPEAGPTGDQTAQEKEPSATKALPFRADGAEQAEKWRLYMEAAEKRTVEAVYFYYSNSRNLAYLKLRLPGKRYYYGRFKDGKFVLGRGTKKAGGSQALYGAVSLLSQAGKDGATVYLTEGEKDCDAILRLGQIAVTYGGPGDWDTGLADFFKGCNVVVLGDNDKSGRQVAARIEQDLAGTAWSVRVVFPCKDKEGGDVTDYLTSGGTLEALEQTGGEDSLEYQIERIGLRLDRAPGQNGHLGKALQTVHNMIFVLEEDPRWKGLIRKNSLLQQISASGPLPWDLEIATDRPWGSSDDAQLFHLIQQDYGLNSRQDLMDALKVVADRHVYHPVKELLESIEWDGEDHIRPLLVDYLGAEDNDYNHQVMQLFLQGAIRRIYEPGCKYDYCMIIAGPQGIGKSTFLRKLALRDEWFTDSLDSLDGDKAVQVILGIWIAELGELTSLGRTRSGMEGVKRFISATSDRIRIPYERRADTFPRQIVFAGTTNKSEFLVDETGNRRFLIVEAGKQPPAKSLFCAEAEQDIRQAWAQALVLYEALRPELVLPPEYAKEAACMQENAMQDDVRVGLIRRYLDTYGPDKVCAAQLWQEALGNKDTLPSKRDSTQLNQIMSAIPGWERADGTMRFKRYGAQRGFRRIEQAQEAGPGTPNQEPVGRAVTGQEPAV